MNWTYDKSTMTALSDCGYYRISGALNNARIYWNAWFLPTSRSIDGTYDKAIAKSACEAHAAKMARLKAEVSGVNNC